MLAVSKPGDPLITNIQGGEDSTTTKELIWNVMTGFSNNDRSLLLFSFEFSTITFIYAWIILQTELTLIIANYKCILAGVKGMHRRITIKLLMNVLYHLVCEL